MKKPDFDAWCRAYADARMKEEYGSADLCPDDDAYNAYLHEAGYEYHAQFGWDEGDEKEED